MNTRIDCKNFSTEDYPQIKKGMFVELWNGDKGHIEKTDGYHSVFHFEEENFHCTDIKYIECNLKDLL